jgi:hypothetical protein
VCLISTGAFGFVKRRLGALNELLELLWAEGTMAATPALTVTNPPGPADVAPRGPRRQQVPARRRDEHGQTQRTESPHHFW